MKLARLFSTAAVLALAMGMGMATMGFADTTYQAEEFDVTAVDVDQELALLQAGPEVEFTDSFVNSGGCGLTIRCDGPGVQIGDTCNTWPVWPFRCECFALKPFACIGAPDPGN